MVLTLQHVEQIVVISFHTIAKITWVINPGMIDDKVILIKQCSIIRINLMVLKDMTFPMDCNGLSIEKMNFSQPN